MACGNIDDRAVQNSGAAHRSRNVRLDTLSTKERSERMALVRSKNTGPELLVRSIVFALGYRYRLHARDLPGCPDLVFRKLHKVIFVHGCFWHRHATCGLARLPKSRLSFWKPKLEANKERDKRIKRDLTKDGWNVLTIWECQLKNGTRVRTAIRRFLDAQR